MRYGQGASIRSQFSGKTAGLGWHGVRAVRIEYIHKLCTVKDKIPVDIGKKYKVMV
jgi:hypothetical protein